MTRASRTLSLWSPRILGVLTALFLGLFALDAVDEGAAAFLIHVAPGVLLTLVVVASWRQQWAGAVVFIALAVFYSVMARSHPSWILAISGPLLMTGLLFLWSWRHSRETSHVRELWLGRAVA